MHMNGTMAPSVPIWREYMKCVAYVLPLIVTSLHTWEHQRVMNIAQDFLEVIGTRVTRYQQGVRKLNWQYRLVLSTSTVMPNTIQTTFPMPTTSSSITILGQGLEDLRSLDQHSTFISSLMTPSSTTCPDNITSLRLEVSQLCANLQAAYDEIACLKAVYQPLNMYSIKLLLPGVGMYCLCHVATAILAVMILCYLHHIATTMSCSLHHQVCHPISNGILKMISSWHIQILSWMYLMSIRSIISLPM